MKCNRKYLSVGLTAVMCCMMTLEVNAAGPQGGGSGDDRGKDSVHHPARKRPPTSDQTFTRMFSELPPYAPATDEERAEAEKLGKIAELMDAGDQLNDPVASIVAPDLNPDGTEKNPNNPNMTAGVTFFGQFLDHDITLDLKSPLHEPADPRRTTNFRTAAFDLDSLYGGGPQESPELYDLSSGDVKFKVEAIPGSVDVSRKGAVRFDLPRDANNNAIIGDSRNDEHLIIAQFHLAMLQFHNAVTDHLRETKAFQKQPAQKVFQEAQRLVRWHYQWIIVHEFLPLTIGQKRVNDLLNKGLRFYQTDGRSSSQRSPSNGNPLIPIEFSVAAYRFGHSQVRPSYRVNFGPDGGSEPFFAFVFDDTEAPNEPNPDDLRGGKRAPRRFVDWQTFFDFGDGNSRPNKKIDTKISSVLMELPGVSGPAPGLPSDGVQSLPSRNLMRHVNFGLPSGQAVARMMRVPVLDETELAELEPYGMKTSTPLWYYILKEAEVMENGLRLGPVGSGIVGEVFIGLLQADRSSYLAKNRDWKPVLPSTRRGEYRMTDMLRFAGVVVPLD